MPISYMHVISQKTSLKGFRCFHLTALELDGLANSHAVRIPVEDPNRIGEIFDAISYKKVRVQGRKLRV